MLPLADAILHRLTELRIPLLEPVRHENRIVAKPAATARRAQHAAAADAFKHEFVTARRQHEKHTEKMRAAILVRHVVQRLDQFRHVRRPVALRPGVVRGFHPGATVERIHADPAVIRQDERTRRETFPQRARFFSRIPDESPGVLGHLRHAAHDAGRDDFDLRAARHHRRLREGRELRSLVQVTRG